MFNKDNFSRESLKKMIAISIVIAIFLLTLSVLTDKNDSRRKITSGNQTEETLSSFLSEIDGVGDVSVMIERSSNDEITGVIVSADGAENLVVKSNIVNGVSTLFDIPKPSVMVFQKKNGGLENEENQ